MNEKTNETLNFIENGMKDYQSLINRESFKRFYSINALAYKIKIFIKIGRAHV